MFPLLYIISGNNIVDFYFFLVIFQSFGNVIPNCNISLTSNASRFTKCSQERSYNKSGECLFCVIAATPVLLALCRVELRVL